MEVVCTTDDPIDSLEYHIKTRESGFEIKMLPTWRPDKAMAVEVPADFKNYVEKLAEVSGVCISSFDDMIMHSRIGMIFLQSKAVSYLIMELKNFMQKIIPTLRLELYLIKCMEVRT